jgi:AcrR family transcriptional regulator
MSPKIVEKSQRRQEIALAALEVFAQRGFEATSMSQVAKAAGISKGCIYLYFESKAELTVAAATAWLAGVEKGVAPLIDISLEPLERLRRLLRGSTQAFLSDRRMIMLFVGIVQVALRDRELLDRLDIVRKVSAPIRNAICGILRDGVEQGVFRPEVESLAEQIAINLVAFVDGLGMHYIANPGFFDLTAQIDLYLDGLLHSLRVPTREP